VSESVEITCLYDDYGNCIFIESSKERKIKKLIKQGKSIEGVPGVIKIVKVKE
jgi:hypothetical protein